MMVTRTRTYAVCPHCEQDAGAIDHLLGSTLTTSWYCDSCGGQYRLRFTPDSVEISQMPGRKITTADVVMLPPQTKPVYFVVEGMRFEGEDHGDRDEHGSKQFFYDEHSCTTNWFKPEMVYFDGDSDPHGLIEFVDFVDASTLPPDEDYGPNPHDAALVALVEKHARKVR